MQVGLIWSRPLVTISALRKIDQIFADRNSKFSDYKDEMSEPW